jgi:5-(carboxyamino)imidazole ribonucleotide synthase
MVRFKPDRQTIFPGAAIGVLGGGQLGRMIALAAAPLGYRTHVFAPEADPPAGQVTPQVTRADYLDRAALEAFARSVAVVTFEFENVPVAAAEIIAAAGTPVRPSPRALAVAQDRVQEKRLAESVGLATAPWRAVGSADELAAALAAIGAPAILKTVRLGYDGKGQARIARAGEAAAAWQAIGAAPAVLEGFVDFACEISVIVARSLDGAETWYGPVENRHRNGILDATIAPARVSALVADAAVDAARRLARALDIVGLLAVELFVTRDERVLVNEIAPRPHNSGHYTIDACGTSQFAQLVRAICGLPLGDTRLIAPAVMRNLIGAEVSAWTDVIGQADAHVHLYGKADARAGRKMGHVTWVGADSRRALAE